MPVTVSFIGGPRHNKKNTLHGRDIHPEQIAVSHAECKAVNMKPGHYVKGTKHLRKDVPCYLWVVD